MGYTFEQIMNMLPKGYTIVYLPEHINTATAFQVRCDKGHDWPTARIGNIRNNKSICPICLKEKRGINSRASENEVVSRLESLNYVLISNYLGASKKVTIRCKECGDIRSSFISNIRESCKKCYDAERKKMAFQALDRRLMESGYSILNEIDKNAYISNIRLHLQCKNKHEPYWAFFKKFVHGGQRCLKCVGLSRLTLNDIRLRLDKGYAVEGTYINEISPLIFTCPNGMKYADTWNNYQQGHRCTCCSDNKSTMKLSKEEVIRRLSILNLKLVDDSIEYENVLTEIYVQCTLNSNHLPFKKKFAHMYANSVYCPDCQYTGKSKAQMDIENYLNSIGAEVKLDRSLGFEIDIYSNKYKIGIEYCGLFYHNEITKDPEYHMRKWEKCEEKNIKLITLYEDEYLRNISLVQMYLRSLFVTRKKIDVKECIYRILDKKDAISFHSKFCVFGIPNRGIIELKSYGLFYNDILLIVVSFNRHKDCPTNLILERYSYNFDYVVQSGLENLIDYSLTNYKNIDKVIYYFNRRFPHYATPVGFEFETEIQPRFDFVRGRERKTLDQLRIKDETIEQTAVLRKNQGWVKMYDCGHEIWAKKVSGADFKEYTNEFKCWQRILKEKLLSEDLTNHNFLMECIDTIKIDDFDFSFVDVSDQEKCQEIKNFVVRYEWLGNMPLRPTHRFEARYKGLLGGVVVLSIPNAFSHILGDDYKRKEKLISRGATASWTPKNLASALIMYAIRWMVKNTEFRVFTAYSDPEANEFGTIYQACNFYYLGNKFGSKILYFDPLNEKTGWFSDRTFRKINRVKQYAKECGIQWDNSWNDRWTILWDKIPIDYKLAILDRMDQFKRRCFSKEVESKHKYCYILGKDKKETAKLRKSFLDKNMIYPYPKRINQPL